MRRRVLEATDHYCVVFRDGSMTAPGGPTSVPVEESRSQIDEQPIPKLGGPTYKQVKPKTYQVLEEQLAGSEDTSPAAAPGTSGSFKTRSHHSSHLIRIGHTGFAVTADPSDDDDDCQFMWRITQKTPPLRYVSRCTAERNVFSADL